jgi:hypothetical protein
MTTTMSELKPKSASRSDRERFGDVLALQRPPMFATAHRH